MLSIELTEEEANACGDLADILEDHHLELDFPEALAVLDRAFRALAKTQRTGWTLLD